MEKGFKLKFRKLSWIIPTFAEVTGEKLVGGDLFGPPSSIGLKMLFGITVKILNKFALKIYIFIVPNNVLLYLAVITPVLSSQIEITCVKKWLYAFPLRYE